MTPELVGKTAQRGPLGRLLAAGLANVRAPRPVMKEAIEEVGHGVIHDLERFLTRSARSPRWRRCWACSAPSSA